MSIKSKCCNAELYAPLPIGYYDSAEHEIDLVKAWHCSKCGDWVDLTDKQLNELAMEANSYDNKQTNRFKQSDETVPATRQGISGGKGRTTNKP